MTAHDSEALREDERTILLDPCACGHTLNNHGSLAGCWTCLDDGGDCDVSCEALIAERVARIVAERVRAVEGERDAAVARLGQAYDDGYNDAVTMARCYGHTDHWPEEDEPRNPYRLSAALGGDQGQEGPQEGAGGGVEGLGDVPRVDVPGSGVEGAREASTGSIDWKACW